MWGEIGDNSYLIGYYAGSLDGSMPKWLPEGLKAWSASLDQNVPKWAILDGWAGCQGGQV